MLSPLEDLDVSEYSRAKTLALAHDCSWLGILVAHQDLILMKADGPETCCSATAWPRQRAAFDGAVKRQFEFEELVLDASLDAMGLRAHIVVADATRQRIRAELRALGELPWNDGAALIRRLRSGLAGHFVAQKSCSYRPLRRQQSESTEAALSERCRIALEGATR